MEIPYEKTLADLFRWRVAESGEDVAHKFLYMFAAQICARV